jgi:hypothetical protein
MSTLTDFLNEQAQRLAQPEVQRLLAEWKQSVDALMKQIKVSKSGRNDSAYMNSLACSLTSEGGVSR